MGILCDLRLNLTTWNSFVFVLSTTPATKRERHDEMMAVSTAEEQRRDED